MFPEYSHELLRAGIIELKAGNRTSARRYLDRCVYMSADHDVMAEAWYRLSQTTDDPGERRQALENCLANDLHHARARRALAILAGTLNVGEIIDPNLPSVPASTGDAGSQRITCPRCGGRMLYAPDGRSLVCEYCRGHERVSSGAPSSSGNDFILAMATHRGHSRPLREQVRRCQGCGAEFIRAGAEISFSCPYCDSPHVMAIEASANLISPDGIIPHQFDEHRAREILSAWLREHKLASDVPISNPRGLYVPVWTFTLGGGIDYVGENMRPHGALRGPSPEKVQIRDRYPVMLTISVGASRRPSAALVRLISGFDLKTRQSYDPRYLAAWPAELYDVPMAEASLEARRQAYLSLQQQLPAKLPTVHLLSTSSASLMIESFTLDLLAAWTCELQVDAHRSMLMINGQTGAVAGVDAGTHLPAKGGLLQQLGELLND